eukprot:CAMPEP_0118894424 /NCGR_PEP_ID=MMETSP1166-20130328/3207_1 /TAXON_ID=1104430 /ORGANISM="Chrysoreinhardia sp, Strain CCMP3193" /LENGTH=550 /DNA_ID=CAMNT_0006833331 /DNA_START=333 /DNA_END=1982 /DNA_ORIENTATION=+
MPKTFRVNPNDRVVRAVVGITTGPRAVTDEQLLALVRQSGDAAFQHLTIDEMNTRLGPKTGSSYAVKDLGIFRQHYKINGQRRCAYVVLSPDELRVGSVGSGSLFFPRGEDDVLNERAERIERPFLLEDGEEEETDDTEMIDAIPAGAAGGRKRKETTKTNMTPAGKKERPEQPALEDLMKVEEQPPCVATRQVVSLLQREAELEKRLAEQTVLAAGYFADFAERHARVAALEKKLVAHRTAAVAASTQLEKKQEKLKRLQASCDEKETQTEGLHRQVKSLERQLADYKRVVADLDETDETDAPTPASSATKETATSLIKQVRKAARTLNAKKRLFTALALVVSPTENCELQAALASSKPNFQEEAKVLHRLGLEVDAFVKSVGKSQAEIFDAYFDSAGLIKDDVDITDLHTQLCYPLEDAPPESPESLLSRVLAVLLQSTSFVTKTRNARSALEKGQSWRFNHRKKDGSDEYVAPALSAIRVDEDQPSDLEVFIVRRETKIRLMQLVLASIALSSRTGGGKTTLVHLLVSLDVGWIGRLTHSGINDASA